MTKKAKKSEREFNVLIGFDVPAGRWNIGDPLKESDLKPDEVRELLEQKAIEVKE